MIEVNLVLGEKKKGGGGFSFGALVQSVKRLVSGGDMLAGSYVVFFFGAAVVSFGYMGMTFLGVQSATDDLNVSLEVVVQDSIRNAVMIQRATELKARGASIQARVAMIQKIDAGRYAWPHLLDEIAAAVPDFTWLSGITHQRDAPLQVRVAGRAGSIFAITRFMRRLEVSRFLEDVQNETIQEVLSETNSGDFLFMFELTLTYVGPPLDELQTVPLFDDATSQAQITDMGN